MKDCTQIFGLKTPVIRMGDEAASVVLEALENNDLHPEYGDIIVIAESALATSEGRIVELSSITPGEKSLELGGKYNLDPREVEIIIDECDEVLGGVTGALLTMRDGNVLPNAGVDNSNAPPGCVVLLPSDPQKSAEQIRGRLEEVFKCRLGVIVSDSRTHPLRLGCVGIALGCSGIDPVEDIRGEKDIFGRTLNITHKAVADNLASSALLVMGEAAEQTPIALIRGAPVSMVEEDSSIPNAAPDECMYFGVLGKQDHH